MSFVPSFMLKMKNDKSGRIKKHIGWLEYEK